LDVMEIWIGLHIEVIYGVYEGPDWVVPTKDRIEGTWKSG